MRRAALLQSWFLALGTAAVVFGAGCKARRESSEAKDVLTVDQDSGAMYSIAVRSVAEGYPKKDPQTEVCVNLCQGSITSKLQGALQSGQRYVLSAEESEAVGKECSNAVSCVSQEKAAEMMQLLISNPLKRAQFVGVLYGQRVFPIVPDGTISIAPRPGVKDPNLAIAEVLAGLRTAILKAKAPKPGSATETPAVAASAATPQVAASTATPQAAVSALPLPDPCTMVRTMEECQALWVINRCAWGNPSGISKEGTIVTAGGTGRCVALGIENCPNYNGLYLSCIGAADSNGNACSMTPIQSTAAYDRSKALADLGICKSGP